VALRQGTSQQDAPDDHRAGEFVIIEVTDTGPGMDSDTLAKIFEPYFTTKSAERGTGLGLAVVHGIVQDHGGWIDAASRPGRGSTFTVGLPLSKRVEGLSESQESDTEPRGHERVLLVDDEDDLVNLCVRGLGDLGYEVTGFTRPAEALAVFGEDPADWDLVVTDMTMPGLTGLSLSAAMLDIRPDLPIILCTGYSDSVTRDSVLGIGIAAFAMKPLSIADLACEVRAQLDRRSV